MALTQRSTFSRPRGSWRRSEAVKSMWERMRREWKKKESKKERKTEEEVCTLHAQRTTASKAECPFLPTYDTNISLFHHCFLILVLRECFWAMAVTSVHCLGSHAFASDLDAILAMRVICGCNRCGTNGRYMIPNRARSILPMPALCKRQ